MDDLRFKQTGQGRITVRPRDPYPGDDYRERQNEAEWEKKNEAKNRSDKAVSSNDHRQLVFYRRNQPTHWRLPELPSEEECA